MIAAVLLAAGSSRRMGSKNKLLLPFSGIPIVRKVVQSVLDADVQRIVVVTGFEAELVERALESLPVEFARNEAHASGMASSIAAGIRTFDTSDIDGAMIIPGDLPYLSPSPIRQAADLFRQHTGNRIILPLYRGKQGHPVVFPRRYFAALTALVGDAGAKPILRQAASEIATFEAPDDGILRDIDRPADLPPPSTAPKKPA